MPDLFTREAGSHREFVSEYGPRDFLLYLLTRDLQLKSGRAGKSFSIGSGAGDSYNACGLIFNKIQVSACS